MLEGLHVHGSGTQRQGCVLQLCELEPEQDAPPQEGAGELQARVCVPPPQGTEQALQPLQPPATGRQQAWLLGPAQGAPPQEGAGLLQMRVCVPPEQALQLLQPPAIGKQPQGGALSTALLSSLMWVTRIMVMLGVMGSLQEGTEADTAV